MLELSEAAFHLPILARAPLGFPLNVQSGDVPDGSVVLGATTYSEVEGTDDEEYATTYREFGGRSDHLTNLVASATGTELDKQLVSSAASDEQEYCGSVEMNQKRKEDQEASKDAKAAAA